MWPLLGLFALPLIEIALFVQIGGAIGLGATLLWVLGTGVFGSWLIRRAGARALADLRAPLGGLRNPAEPVAQEGLLVLAGVLLILPGFFTDALGLLLLVPPLRTALLRAFGRRVATVRFDTVGFGMGGRPANDPRTGPRGGPAGQGGPRRADIIDGEFTEISDGPALPGDEGPRPGQPPSGWTRH